MVQEQGPSMPLTEADKEALDGAIEAGESITELIARAKVAGIDVEAHEKELAVQVGRAKSIRQAFFPNQ